MVQKKVTKKNTFLSRAEKCLVGGVSSPVRAFKAAGGDPLYFVKGKGAHLWSFDGKKFIDYGLGWGSMILGYANPTVVKAARRGVKDGMYFGTTNPYEVALAEAIKDAVPGVEQLRFTVSGTEAVMGALRLARGFTGRPLVIMFENSYHGHADHLLVKAGSGLVTCGLPASKGVPGAFSRNTIVLPYGDKTALVKAFRSCGTKIAAVIFEPVAGNYGVIPPDKGFLKLLRQVTRRHGALLVADEVITGFRFHYGSCSWMLGILPDLFCFGKIIGGGMPGAAYGGRAEAMNCLAPIGGVYQASTFSGHPVAMAAGGATLARLRSLRLGYPRIAHYAAELASALRSGAEKAGLNADVAQYGPMFSVRFDKDGAFRVFYRTMLEQGVYFAPSAFETNFISFSHTANDLERTKKAVARAMITTGKMFCSCA